MNNIPMTSNQQIKLLIFAILLAPSLFFLVGIIPALFLVFRLVMMKKNSDFSHIETSGQYFKYYFYILLAVCALFALYLATPLGAEHRWVRRADEFLASISLGGIAIFYIVILNFLFLNPLRRHSEWVVKNGIFSSKAKVVVDSSDVDIIKGERLRTFSVADELIKWAKLKDDGHITEQEFNDARKKLLQ